MSFRLGVVTYSLGFFPFRSISLDSLLLRLYFLIEVPWMIYLSLASEGGYTSATVVLLDFPRYLLP